MSQTLEQIIDSVAGPIATQEVRVKIEALEAEWKKLPQVDIPVIHRYSGGIYAREIIIPADTFITGRVYKDDHFDVMVYGDVTVTSDDGRKRLTGFNISNGNQGKKRAGYTHAETKWITFCSSEEMDEDDYLDHLTVEKFSELSEGVGLIDESEIVKTFRAQVSYKSTDYAAYKSGYLAAIGKQCREDIDRLDYKATLEEYGFTEEVARAQSEDESNQVSTDENYKVSVMPSMIEGDGLFSQSTFTEGETIMPARINGKRTEAGRYTNHSLYPNAVMVMVGNDIDLVAKETIDSGDEITTDYRDSLNLQIRPISND